MKALPQNFIKEAQAPDLDRLKESIRRYYGGEDKEYRADADGFTLHSLKDGRQLSCRVFETPRGFYFGYFP
jgi:hypothetical protein